MARGQARELHSPDFVDDTDDGAVDFAHCMQGALTADIPVVSVREFQDAVEMEKFMSEPLTISIHTSSDKNAPPAVFVGVNGQQAWFRRGTRVKGVPRRMVEVMARSQSTTYRTQQVRNPNDDEQMQTLRTTSSDYGFSVIHDPNPKGAQWLARVTREGS